MSEAPTRTATPLEALELLEADWEELEGRRTVVEMRYVPMKELVYGPDSDDQ